MANLVKAHIWEFGASVWDPEYQESRTKDRGHYVLQESAVWPKAPLTYATYDPVKAQDDFMERLAVWLNEKPHYRLNSWRLSYRGEDYWWGCWFSHATLSTFTDEREMKNNFREWLEQKGFRLNYTSDHAHEYHNEALAKKLDMSLMAADDYWRWRRCDCEGCKKNPDKWIIVH